jgi:PRC-barrel domain
MAAFDPETLDRWRALAIVDRDGGTVGTISEFYLDRDTGHPTWALVSTGLFGTTRTFVPLIHATEISDGLQVPYEKSHIKDAPSVDLHDELSPEEEAALFAHYGVEYQPSGDPAPPPGPGEGPEPAPIAAPGAGGSASTVDADPGSGEPPGPVAAEPGSGEPQGPGATEPGSTEPPGPAAAESVTVEAPAPNPAEPGSGEAPGPAMAGSVTVEAPETGETEQPAPPDSTDGVPAEPGTYEPTAREDLDAEAPTGAVPDEPGTTEPETAERFDPDGLRAEGADTARLGSAFEHREGTPADDHSDRFQTAPAGPDLPPTTTPDPDLSRTAPVEPGLPGSTAASRHGPVPTTIDKGTDPTESPTGEPPPPPGEAGWGQGAAGSFEEQEPTARPLGSSDRWRETRSAAERDRAARSAATRSEDRSPFGRARRRLERLVGGGRQPIDPDPISPADRDAAERARRARLGLEDDDNRRR